MIGKILLYLSIGFIGIAIFCFFYLLLKKYNLLPFKENFQGQIEVRHEYVGGGEYKPKKWYRKYIIQIIMLIGIITFFSISQFKGYVSILSLKGSASAIICIVIWILTFRLVEKENINKYENILKENNIEMIQ